MTGERVKVEAMSDAIEAVRTALLVHDAAMEMNRESGFEMFDLEAQAEAFIAALEAQNPSFTVTRQESQP